MRRRHLFLIAVLILPHMASAQAPVVTAVGDPSVNADTIYALAADPSDYPDQSFLYLLDDGIIRHEADGRGTVTYRQIIQILSPEAVDRWSEQTFGYVKDRERFTLNWIRVVKPDGSIVSDGPAQWQESANVPDTEYPIYTDAQTIRVTLGGVAVGTIVDYSTTTEIVTPVLEGDFGHGWRVNPGYPVVRSRYIVDVPEDFDLRLEERNVSFPRQVSRAVGRKTYVWATADVPSWEGEPFAGSPNEVVTTINTGGAIGWDSIAAFYHGLSRDRYTVTDAIRSALSEELAGARTLQDTLQQAYRWIAQDLRYVSLSLGVGGYQPRVPDEVLASRFGDCKDKATLFIAVARAFGVEAYPVLASLNGSPDSTAPSLSQFDHVIAAVGHGEDRVYLDLTAEVIPYGTVPGYLQGEVGVLVQSDGHARIITFPEDPPEANRLDIRLTGTLSEDGTFSGRYEQTASGTPQGRLRSAMVRPSTMTAQDSTRWAQALANGVFQGARAESVELFDGRDLMAEPRIAVQLQAPLAARRTGNLYLLDLPIPTLANPGYVARLETMEERRFPIDVADVVGPITSSWEVKVTLPKGWRAELPDAVSAESRFGSYRSTYTQEGRTLVVTRRLSGRKGLEPKERFGELIEWMRRIADDNVDLIAITPAR